jgi:alkanesulfonate monooxygenase SsuD/methylene tetrahydromethanopterin reductase-like flavin-dependent oxidoreductase (luciferase family)
MDVSDFSVVLCHWGFPPAQPGELIAVVKHAEEPGFHSVGLPHCPVNARLEDFPQQARFAPEGLRYYHFDAVALVPVLLHETKTIKVGFNILITPTWHPFHWAKYLGSLDQMSGGRVVAGFGLGAAFPSGAKDVKTVPSLENLGTSTKRRGKMSDESLELMTQLWTTDGPVSYQGTHWKASEVEFMPKGRAEAVSGALVGG